MKTTLSRTDFRAATNGRTASARTHEAVALHAHVRRAVRTGSLSRPLPRRKPARSLSVLPAGSAAATVVDNLLSKAVFGLFAICGAIMGVTCFWHLQALVMKWSSFEAARTSLLQG